MFGWQIPDKNDGIAGYVPSMPNSVPTSDEVQIPSPPKTKRLSRPTVLVTTRIPLLPSPSGLIP